MVDKKMEDLASKYYLTYDTLYSVRKFIGIQTLDMIEVIVIK
tara:strand:- start:330 stop:455 length:126 start_codon:yes stop_codon:yes gene_type:complete